MQKDVCLTENFSIAEHASHPSELRADGAGLFLSESCKGVAHGLHSKAPQVFELAFKADLLSSGKFVSQVSPHASILAVINPQPKL